MRAVTEPRVPAQLPGPDRAPVRRGARLPDVARLVAAVVVVAAMAAALLGLSVDDLYVGDAATAQMLRGFDAITVLGALVLGIGLYAWWRGMLWGQLTTASMLTYLVYTYAYFLFGTGFNHALLLHVAVFSGSLVGLVLTLATVDPRRLSPAVRAATHVRPSAVVLAVLALALAGMWIYACVAFAVSGDVPAGSSLVETDTMVRLGIVLDLSLLVPGYTAAAYLLWRREAWGYVLAVVMLVSGLLHQLSYLAALLFQSAADVPGAVRFDPVEPVIVLLYAAAALPLVRAGARLHSGKEPT